ncbi:hypothetical protein R5W23_001544 [Gemmata sp. JC673]|uniref:Nucleotide modification associated domain-containing protein n=1 Tax=Gemmata algarum TaxID=2975278 RepID=A0ABU5F0P4_9BACT|nr:hypothetical protein [Gemmata algarum]MDY3560312.1 hypothetical protein [Gemmata algarum]
MPEYVVLGRSFRAKKGQLRDDHGGRVIGSRDAFYLVVYFSPAGAAVASGGLLGGLLAAASSALSDKTVYDQITTLSELPSEVTGHPDWPIKKADRRPVIVVPRSAVKRVKYRWWHTFDLICENQSYYIGPRVFGRRAVLKQLRDWGWEF